MSCSGPVYLKVLWIILHKIIWFCLFYHVHKKFWNKYRPWSWYAGTLCMLSFLKVFNGWPLFLCCMYLFIFLMGKWQSKMHTYSLTHTNTKKACWTIYFGSKFIKITKWWNATLNAACSKNFIQFLPLITMVINTSIKAVTPGSLYWTDKLKDKIVIISGLLPWGDAVLCKSLQDLPLRCTLLHLRHMRQTACVLKSKQST